VRVPSLRAALLSLALFFVGCGSLSPVDVPRICVTTDAAGKALTLAASTLRATYEAELDRRFRLECSDGSADDRHTCRARVAGIVREEWSDRWQAQTEIVAAQNQVVLVLETTHECGGRK